MGGISFTHEKKDVDLGPVQIQHNQKDTPISPILNTIALIGGLKASYAFFHELTRCHCFLLKT
jgi:hypothetical protein